MAGANIENHQNLCALGKDTVCGLYGGIFAGLFWLALGEHVLGAILCMMGTMVSQFTVAVTFYENYKELEIPHE